MYRARNMCMHCACLYDSSNRHYLMEEIMRNATRSKDMISLNRLSSTSATSLFPNGYAPNPLRRHHWRWSSRYFWTSATPTTLTYTGAGAAAAAALKAEACFEVIKVFERREAAGGTWYAVITAYRTITDATSGSTTQTQTPFHYGQDASHRR